MITDPTEILNEQKIFYEKLYTSTNQKDSTYLQQVQFVTFPEEERDKLDAPILIQEIGNAVKNMKNNKVPGTDGFPAEWYKMFWGKIKKLLHEVYLEALNDGELHLTAKRGVIALLEKIGCDILSLKSWRPITLLNVDYKIYSKY